jgi:dihydroorotate dehydrogenase
MTKSKRLHRARCRIVKHYVGFSLIHKVAGASPATFFLPYLKYAMVYSLLKNLLFQIDPETAHHKTMHLLRYTLNSPLKSLLQVRTDDLQLKPVSFAGLSFPHPVGLAAGFDKDGILYPHWSAFGFSFAELGTVTPKPQAGNPKPRLFRLKEDQAIINRMGFNNQGAQALAHILASHKPDCIIGGNIGKNKDTPNEDAVRDYMLCMDVLAPVVDYFTINISSPNTPGLRDLQEKSALQTLLRGIMQHAKQLSAKRPVFVKIAPDLESTAISEMLDVFIQEGIQGIVAGNTTLQRSGLKSPISLTNEAGGLSGKPLTQRSTEIIRFIAKETGGSMPIIGVGGIFSADDSQAKLDVGAHLIQLYTGFVYEGPGLVRKILEKIQY